MATQLEYLTSPPKLPWASYESQLAKLPPPLRDYMYELVKTLTEILDQLYERVNLQQESDNQQWHYSSTANPITGLYPESTWRWGANDDNQFEIQKYVSGAWVAVVTEDV